MRVIDLAGGSVLGPRGWIFTQAADLLPECTWYGDALRPDQIPGSFGPALRLRGTCLSLASDFAVGNYGHFLLDCLPRLGIVDAAGIALDSIDHFYLPRPPGDTARLLLQRLGIAESRCVWADRPCRVQPDRLLATSFPGRRRDYPPSTAAFLRSIRPPPSRGGRRLFIPRHGKRQTVNEAALWAIAERHGFELYDFSRVADEPGVFAQAETVVGAHGSGLANIAFCQPRTQILELIPSDHVHPYYASLARAAGLEYSYIVGDSLRRRPPGSWGPSHYPFAVDPGVFEQALIAMSPAPQQDGSTDNVESQR